MSLLSILPSLLRFSAPCFYTVVPYSIAGTTVSGFALQDTTSGEYFMNSDDEDDAILPFSESVKIFPTQEAAETYASENDLELV